MIFCQELHYCPECRDFVPYIASIRDPRCAECGRLFTDDDERAYCRYSRWNLPEREWKPLVWHPAARRIAGEASSAS